MKDIIDLIRFVAEKILGATVPDDVKRIRSIVENINSDLFVIHIDYTSFINNINAIIIDRNKYEINDIQEFFAGFSRHEYRQHVLSAKNYLGVKREELIKTTELVNSACASTKGRVADELKLYLHYVLNYFQIPLSNYDIKRYTLYESLDALVEYVDNGEYSEDQLPSVFFQISSRINDYYAEICSQYKKVEKAQDLILF
jgi:hypothetical protein